MDKVVRIYGMAPNLGKTPPPNPGDEVWLSNWYRGYNKRLPRALEEWTHYFNLHSRKHMNETYPGGVEWHQRQDGTRPCYFQKHQPDLPGSTVFPRKEIEAAFPEAMGPGGFYSVCSTTWLIPFAALRGATQIQLWGFELRDKPEERHAFERPCMFYWIDLVRSRGIELIHQPEILIFPWEPGDPATFKGPVYGYETKPESDL